LKQEIAYFDKQVSTGEVVERISGDTVVIQDAMGEKVHLSILLNLLGIRLNTNQFQAEQKDN